MKDSISLHLIYRNRRWDSPRKPPKKEGRGRPPNILLANYYLLIKNIYIKFNSIKKITV